MREGGSSRVKEPLVEIEEEEELESHVRVKAMAMKVCSIKAKEVSPKWSKEMQENQRQDLGIEVVPTKIGDHSAKERT